jgi:hypothetical protein
MKIKHAHVVLIAEAIALKQWLVLAQSLGCNRTIMESDNMEVVETMNNGWVMA